MRITNKERRLFIVSAIFALVWAGYAFGLKPALERIETLKRVIPENEKKLQQLIAKSRQYNALSAILPDITESAKSQNDFELAAYLESVYTNSGLAKKVVTMKQSTLPVDSKYSEMVVELQLDNITLQQLIGFLLKTDLPNRPLWVKSLYISKANSNPDLIGASLQLSCLKLNPA